MPISISHLRRWVAGALILVCVVVAGVYFYARKRVKNALREVPEKIGLQVQQSAQGFTISKSEQGRTLFKVQASKAVQFKSGGKAELHDVAITLFGSDSSRFDQIYGKDFEYDPQSGDVTSKSEVQIDLQSNPEGALSTDQAPPKELKNPIHLRTTNLVFNKNTGDARTPDEVDFRVPQGSGSSVGAIYVARTGSLTLQSQVHITLSGQSQANIFAEQAVLEKNPREIKMRAAKAESKEQRGQADELTLFLRPDNTLDRAVGNGNVQIESSGPTSPKHGRAQQPSVTTATANRAEVEMKPANLVQKAVLSGDVHLKSEGQQAAEAWAGRAELSFSGKNVITKVHAEDQVKVLQAARQRTSGGEPGRQPSQPAPDQPVEITAPAMNFLLAGGNRLKSAETAGPPQIRLLPADAKSGETRITADKFVAAFDSAGQLSRVHGEANARVVSSASAPKGAEPPERVTTSRAIDALFRPGSGIQVISQQGSFAYYSGTQQAFADGARYTPADQMIVLSGSPRILDTGTATTARSVRLNRATGEGFAEGDVKTTYSDLKAQPGGALLAKSDPIHVTSQSMVARGNSNTAIYTGNARLWQDANVVEAPRIEFQKEQRTLIANSDGLHQVSTVLMSVNSSGKATPMNVTAARLIYRDAERKARYDGGVTVRSADVTVTAKQMDVFLAASSGENAGPATAVQRPDSVPAKLDKIVATGGVVITEPTRRGTGEQLTYTASDDKFVLTGGPPSIFDAEQGKITGVSLTLFRHDDRVVVEGNGSSPAVTHTRMER